MDVVVAGLAVVAGFAEAFVVTGVAVGFVVAAEVFDAACVLRDGAAEMTNPNIAKNKKSEKNFILNCLTLFN